MHTGKLTHKSSYHVDAIVLWYVYPNNEIPNTIWPKAVPMTTTWWPPALVCSHSRTQHGRILAAFVQVWAQLPGNLTTSTKGRRDGLILSPWYICCMNIKNIFICTSLIYKLKNFPKFYHSEFFKKMFWSVNFILKMQCLCFELLATSIWDFVILVY